MVPGTIVGRAGDGHGDDPSSANDDRPLRSSLTAMQAAAQMNQSLLLLVSRSSRKHGSAIAATCVTFAKSMDIWKSIIFEPYRDHNIYFERPYRLRLPE